MLSWFKKKKSEEDYEQILASLALSIQKRQTQLSEIRLRERRATLLVTIWAFSAWAGYVALWWTGVLGQKGRGVRNAVWGLPVVIGPIVILFTRRIVQLWYARKGNAEEKSLKELLVKQRNKIEEIKNKTNYYSTKSLLDRYDDGTKQSNGPSTPNTQRRIPPQTPQSQGRVHPQAVLHNIQPSQASPQTPITPIRGGMPSVPYSRELAFISPIFDPLNANTNPQTAVIGQLPPPRKQWYDKLADALLGDDAATTGPQAGSRYALICEKCFTHNGLVKEDQWEDAQYLCPKCGHFNKSMRARKALRTSPNSPVSAAATAITTTTTSALPPTLSSAVPSTTSSDTPSQDTEPHHDHVPTSPVMTKKRKPEKSPLSESTVLVEKSDAEEMDIDS